MKKYIFLLLFAGSCMTVFSQKKDSLTSTIDSLKSVIDSITAKKLTPLENKTPIRVDETTNGFKGLFDEFWLVVLMVGSGLIIFGGVIYVIKTKDSVTTNTIRLIITILILNYVVILVMAGFSNNQIAPVISLLGSIAGYLLGRTDKDVFKDGEKPDNDRKDE